MSRAKASSVGNTGHSRGPVGNGGFRDKFHLPKGAFSLQKDVKLLKLTIAASYKGNKEKKGCKSGLLGENAERKNMMHHRQEKSEYLRHLSLIFWMRAHCLEGKGER